MVVFAWVFVGICHFSPLKRPLDWVCLIIFLTIAIYSWLCSHEGFVHCVDNLKPVKAFHMSVLIFSV